MKTTQFAAVALGIILSFAAGTSAEASVSGLFPPQKIPAEAESGGNLLPTHAANPRSILFIHGMFMTPKSWNGWMGYFSDPKRGYQVSAPAWPLHSGEPASLRADPARQAALVKLTLGQVVESYRQVIRARPTGQPTPICIGHSMGGLVAQKLLAEDLCAAAVAIDSAAPKGVVVLQNVHSPEFRAAFQDVAGILPEAMFGPMEYGLTRFLFRALLEAFSHGKAGLWADANQQIELGEGDFGEDFLNEQDRSAWAGIYREQYVPESRRVGRAPLTADAAIPTGKANPGRRGPLLIVAGGKDRLIPAPLSYENFRRYTDDKEYRAASYVGFRLFEGRDHWIVGSPGWENVAQEVERWLNRVFQ